MARKCATLRHSAVGVRSVGDTGVLGGAKRRYLSPPGLCALLRWARDGSGPAAPVARVSAPPFELWRGPEPPALVLVLEGAEAHPKSRLRPERGAGAPDDDDAADPGARATLSWNATSGRNRAFYVVDAQYGVLTMRYSAWGAWGHGGAAGVADRL
jgi:hypothetical protein